MPLTPKQEKFAQVWHATGNKSEAYRQAYNCGNMTDAAIVSKAYEVSVNGEVAVRFSELQKAAQKRNDTTVDTLDAMYKEAWKIGREIKNPSAMVSAVSGLAKLHGLNAPDKVERVDDTRTQDVTIRIVDAS